MDTTCIRAGYMYQVYTRHKLTFFRNWTVHISLSLNTEGVDSFVDALHEQQKIASVLTENMKHLINYQQNNAETYNTLIASQNVSVLIYVDLLKAGVVCLQCNNCVIQTARNASACVGKQPIMVATASTEHSYWLVIAFVA